MFLQPLNGRCKIYSDKTKIDNSLMAAMDAQAAGTDSPMRTNE
jgi:hypothetical protein